MSSEHQHLGIIFKTKIHFDKDQISSFTVKTVLLIFTEFINAKLGHESLQLLLQNT